MAKFQTKFVMLLPVYKIHYQILYSNLAHLLLSDSFSYLANVETLNKNNFIDGRKKSFYFNTDIDLLADLNKIGFYIKNYKSFIKYAEVII